GGVPARLLTELRKFVMPRPITNRLELLATLLAAGRSRHFKVFAFASAKDIAEAMRRVSRSLHEELRPRRWREVGSVVQYLHDFPETHNGTIVGLTDKAIRWHRDCQHEVIKKVICELGESTPLAKPSVPLPDVAGVRFLATVGDVCNEAE